MGRKGHVSIWPWGAGGHGSPGGGASLARRPGPAYCAPPRELQGSPRGLQRYWRAHRDWGVGIGESGAVKAKN